MTETVGAGTLGTGDFGRLAGPGELGRRRTGPPDRQFRPEPG